MTNKYRFTQVRHAEQVADCLPWKLITAQQLSRGSFCCDIESLGNTDISIVRRICSTSLREIAVIPEGFICLLLHPEEGKTYVKGRYFGKGTICTIAGDKQWEVFTQQGATTYALLLNKKSIQQYMDEECAQVFQQFYHQGFDIALATPEITQPIFDHVDILLEKAANSNDDLVQKINQTDKLALITLLGELLKSVRYEDLRSNSNAKLLDRALGFINNNIRRKFTISELADYLHTHQRNVELIFNAYLDLSPREYASNLKLNLVRAALIASANKKVSIAEVANKYGISHMGNFSQSYSKLFLELPSDTVRNHRREIENSVVD
ncbi:helix-turn-helix domain-containing protein [Aurantivibrio plasticivorans]